MDLPEDLPHKVMTVVWSHDLDAFIEKHLGRPWSMQQNAFYSQEEMVKFEVYPESEATPLVKAWLASPPAQFVGRLSQPPVSESVIIYTDTILNELCNREILPEGDLTVHVYW